MLHNSARRGERGLSLIEALVIVTATAVLALLLLPLISRAAGNNFAIADRSLEAAEAAAAEHQARTLLGALAQQPDGELVLEGTAQSVTFAPSLAEPVACLPAGARTWVRLRIVQAEDGGGRLLCETDARRLELLHWTAGAAEFTYSADGVSWTPGWRETTPAPGSDVRALRSAPLVRFAWSAARADGAVWVMRAGASEPVVRVEGVS